MPRLLRTSAPLALFVVLAFGLAACDSADDEGGSASFQADLATMNTNVSSALATAFQVGFTPGKRVQPRGDCSQRGTVDVTTNNSTTGFDFDITFDDCNGIDGTLDMNGTLSTSGGYTSTINGQLRERCTINYDDFQQSTTASGTVTLNGSYGATCGSESQTCSFSNDTIDANTGASFYTSRCN